MGNISDSRHRKSIRLKDYDYSQPGTYFVTLLTWQRARIFGDIIEEEMHLNSVGQFVAGKLQALPRYFNVQVDSWIVMPNHIHYLITLFNDSKGEASAQYAICNPGIITDASPLLHGPSTGSLGAIIQNYKSVTTRQINKMRGTSGQPVWQRNYYDHIIRDERDLESAYDYILANPTRWADDPANKHSKKDQRVR